MGSPLYSTELAGRYGPFIMTASWPSGSGPASPSIETIAPSGQTWATIVAQVWPDGAIVSIEGDAGPEPDGQLAVIMNGPYLPANSVEYNGDPIYGYVDP